MEQRKIFFEKKLPLAIIFFIVICLALLGFTRGFAQQYAVGKHAAMIGKNGKEILLKSDTKATLTGFTAKKAYGKTYLNWLVKNQKKDGFYIIFRSVNGDKFQFIGTKPGVGVRIHDNISYCFIDNEQPGGTINYKLLHVSVNNTYLVSEEVTVSSNDTNNVIND